MQAQAWQQWAAEKDRLSVTARKAVEGLHRRQLAACVAAWAAEARRQATAKRCLAALRLRLVRAAFSQWQAAAEDSRVQAAAAALQPQALRRCFARWHAAVLLAHQKQQRWERAAAFAFGSGQLKAWKAWASFVAQRRKKRAAEQRFTASMLRRCLEGWQERVARKQRLQVKEAHLRDRAALRLLATTLLKWRANLEARNVSWGVPGVVGESLAASGQPLVCTPQLLPFVASTLCLSLPPLLSLPGQAGGAAAGGQPALQRLCSPLLHCLAQRGGHHGAAPRRLCPQAGGSAASSGDRGRHCMAAQVRGGGGVRHGGEGEVPCK